MAHASLVYVMHRLANLDNQRHASAGVEIVTISVTGCAGLPRIRERPMVAGAASQTARSRAPDRFLESR